MAPAVNPLRKRTAGRNKWKGKGSAVLADRAGNKKQAPGRLPTAPPRAKPARQRRMRRKERRLRAKASPATIKTIKVEIETITPVPQTSPRNHTHQSRQRAARAVTRNCPGRVWRSIVLDPYF